MKDFRGKVAVITGAGRGIGRGIAERCAQEGMKIILAGIGMESLNRTEADLKMQGATVTSIQTDVSKIEDIERLAEKTLSVFGGVHLLVNNAGVGSPLTCVWENTLADWEWTLGVNLWGVIYGIKVFTPIMIEQNTDCHIVNVSSVAGLIDGPGVGIYKVTKHGVVSLSETLYYELMQQNTRVSVSVLCPGFVKTDIMTNERNRPVGLQNKPGEEVISPESEELRSLLVEGINSGISIEQVAEDVFAALREKRLYILPHVDVKDGVIARAENIINERNPALSVAK